MHKRLILGQKGIAAYDIMNKSGNKILIPKGARIQVVGYNETNLTIMFQDLQTNAVAYSTFDSIIPDK